MKGEKEPVCPCGPRPARAPPPGGAPVRRRTKVVDFEPRTAAKMAAFRDFEMSVGGHVGYLSTHILDVYSRFG